MIQIGVLTLETASPINTQCQTTSFVSWIEMCLVCLLPYLVGMADMIYLVGWGALNAGFMYYAYKLKYHAEPGTAMATFKYSIIHLMVLFWVIKTQTQLKNLLLSLSLEV